MTALNTSQGSLRLIVKVITLLIIILMIYFFIRQKLFLAVIIGVLGVLLQKIFNIIINN